MWGEKEEIPVPFYGVIFTYTQHDIILFFQLHEYNLGWIICKYMSQQRKKCRVADW